MPVKEKKIRYLSCYFPTKYEIFGSYARLHACSYIGWILQSNLILLKCCIINPTSPVCEKHYDNSLSALSFCLFIHSQSLYVTLICMLLSLISWKFMKSTLFHTLSYQLEDNLSDISLKYVCLLDSLLKILIMVSFECKR